MYTSTGFDVCVELSNPWSQVNNIARSPNTGLPDGSSRKIGKFPRETPSASPELPQTRSLLAHYHLTKGNLDVKWESIFLPPLWVLLPGLDTGLGCCWVLLQDRLLLQQRLPIFKFRFQLHKCSLLLRKPCQSGRFSDNAGCPPLAFAMEIIDSMSRYASWQNYDLQDKLHQL